MLHHTANPSIRASHIADRLEKEHEEQLYQLYLNSYFSDMW